MGTKVRVLAACTIGGLLFKPDQVVDLPGPLAKAHAAAGDVDPHKDAVAYCVNELKAEVIVYEVPKTPEQLQLEADIAALEAKLAEAPDDAKAAIQAELDAKKAALAALG